MVNTAKLTYCATKLCLSINPFLSENFITFRTLNPMMVPMVIPRATSYSHVM